MSKWVNRNLGGVSLERVRDSEGKVKKYDMYWITQECDSMVLLELLGSGGLRHVVVVYPAKNWILGIAERYPIFHSSDGILWCCGEDARFTGFGEVRRVRDLRPESLLGVSTRTCKREIDWA